MHIAAIDIPNYFAFLTGKFNMYDVQNAYKECVPHEIDTKRYKAYKIYMDGKYSKGKYVHDFNLYYRRTLKFPNGVTQTDVIPGFTAPISMALWWATKVLDCTYADIAKVKSLLKLPYSSPTQFQCEMESHFRFWTNYVYVMLQFI